MEQRIKVFIADESPEFRHAMRENLTRAGIDVVDETDSALTYLQKSSVRHPMLYSLTYGFPSWTRFR